MTRSTIRRGSRGADVKTWQQILGLNPDGIFGPNTEAATKKWQAQNGLVADGIVGARSWAAAASVAQIKAVPPKVPTLVQVGSTVSNTETVRYGSKGAAVVSVQKLLGIEPTGIFEAKTRSAVTSFQKSRGLKADGIVGVNTWRMLRERPPTATKAVAIKAAAPESNQKKSVRVQKSSRKKAARPVTDAQTLKLKEALLKAEGKTTAKAVVPNSRITKPVTQAQANEKLGKSIPLTVLKQGSRGTLVQEWQAIIGATADGIFGSKTAAMTKTWQQTHGLMPDGIVGPATWTKAYALRNSGSSGVMQATMVPTPVLVKEIVSKIEDKVQTMPTWQKVASAALVLGLGLLGLRK